ncbi:MAG: ATP-binding protein [Tannerella sp.]|jgi:ABC-type branched-subunit amino acid transport system ATPase component|nr:ATP-binding protein [Tannerella sp.]
MKEQLSPLVDLINQQKLLRMEYDYEKENFFQLAQKSDVSAKRRRGYCWYPVTPEKSYFNSMNQRVVEVSRSPDDDTDHQFEYGRSVQFFSVDGNGKVTYFKFTAKVNYVVDNVMVIVVPNEAASTLIHSTLSLGVHLAFDNTSFQTMFAALDAVMSAQDNRLAYLREVLLGNFTPRQQPSFSVHVNWLNKYQGETVNKVLASQDVAVVHGPPGTGKTTTLVEIIFETLRRENQVLVCAQSNMAVDWISEKLTDRGISVLRIGNPTRVNDKMLSFTYEKQFEMHPCYRALNEARATYRTAVAFAKLGTDKKKAKLSLLKEHIYQLEMRIRNDLFNENRVISCTLTGAASRSLQGMHFSTLFIDEASQALEAACWVAIAKCNRLVLAGDPCQLPPVIKCFEASKAGLNTTLIDKLIRRIPRSASMLEIQYRMNETIMRFPSYWFYHDRLKAAPEVRDRSIGDRDVPLIWYDTSECNYAEDMPAENSGRINKREADDMVRQLRDYIERVRPSKVLDEHIDFGVISPYRLQVQYLRQLVKKDEFFRPFRKLITIHTVDGFQGQERDVIFLSLVRANEEGNIGFLSDLRRINVAITRARMKLIIYGDTSTLKKNPFYKAFIQFIDKNGRIEVVKNTVTTEEKEEVVS